MDTTKPPASTLPCLFASLTQNYFESNLKPCETKNEQYWRRASANAVKEHVQLFAKYFPELSLLSDSLENYSICEKHYNQIVVNNGLLNHLKQTGISSEKKLHDEVDSLSPEYENLLSKRKNI